MKTFLEYVAEDILRKHGEDLAHTVIVFPNKRASLFINEHLAQLADKPIWSPAYLTISDLFRSQSPLNVADPIKQVSDLHKTFIADTGIDETLDHFYGWGQLLLTDFDDIDKNMASADHVFANLADLHELDDISYLTDEQRAIISQFFSNFTEDKNTELKERFIKLWQHLADIYHHYRQRLESQALAYEGMLYRKVVEQDNLSLEYDKYIFVGFNLLHKVEQTLFKQLKDQGKAYFYWDFDDYYMKGHEAGYYIAQYLHDFPNELDNHSAGIYHQFETPKTIRFISAPTENIQAHYVTNWLDNPQRRADGKQTAILMCDENLLPTIIHCIPNDIEKVNITTGYPLAQTPVASLINKLTTWQIGNHAQFQRRAIEQHPYWKWIGNEMLDSCPQNTEHRTTTILKWMANLLRTIAQKMQREVSQDPNIDSLRNESMFRAYTLVNRMSGLAEQGDLPIDVITLQRLLRQIIQSTTIPFHGEPAEGIQLMGILESRNLDFDHVIILSCNEGNMPKGVNDSSFIPHSLRKAYGLTTVEHKTAIYAYYFHRLLQRASDITITYNNATNDGQSKEMSRFMLQLLVEGGHPINQYYLKTGQNIAMQQPARVEKTPEVMDILMQRFKKTASTHRALLTPTAINTYRTCSLKFFYRYVSKLNELEDDEQEIDDRLFGVVFHEVAQQIYTQFTTHGTRIEKAQIEMLLKSKTTIARFVDDAFRRNLPIGASYNGLQLINREIVIRFIRQLLLIDLRKAPFDVYGLELNVMTDWQIDTPSLHFTTTIGGSIDRLDAIDTDTMKMRIRVVDYKASHKAAKIANDVDEIFAKTDSHLGYYLQTFIYSLIVRNDERLNPLHLPVSPALLYIQHAAEEDYDPTLCFKTGKIIDVQTYEQAFTEQLQQLTNEIFDSNTPFTATAEEQKCQYCPYAPLCGFHSFK